MVAESGIGEQEARLRAEIETEAARKVTRVIDRARRDAEKALDEARKRHERRGKEQLAAAARTAAEKCRAITASIGHEMRKRWLRRREEVLDSVFAKVLEQVRSGEGFDEREALRQLAVEAVAALGTGTIRLRVAPDAAARFDAAAVAGICKAAQPQAAGNLQVEIVADPAISGGLIAERADGKRRFDNTYTTRMVRLKPEFRGAMAQMIGPDVGPSEQGSVANG